VTARFCAAHCNGLAAAISWGCLEHHTSHWAFALGWRIPKGQGHMGSIRRRCSKEEFAQRGDAIYEKNVSPQLKPADKGKFVAIDIESGIYEMDRDELKAGNKLLARLPDAQIWMVRVGHRSVHRIGRQQRQETR
jgi:hypothetical protein